ncbi:ATP-dependent dethiobiotin synthetase BioD [Legionella antarctica]|uniref:ATP-dependent dethiobiotin synthetase BioD n=1 Tax=Legionella antarctica TaxID=2708020 RepID=A0A6F8T596_9GAMM|nr:dethiobiotin synthase [Legionella antarctica]BCA95619.1 ATP-dependent dethiobiotin synthetase BioD [Legionella antarctica]
MKRYFITGTDTDCGKTYVTVKLVEYFTNSVALKPVASGCMVIENELVSTDAQQLQKNSSLSLDEINPWRFKLPVSPHIASKEEGISLSIKEIADYCMDFHLTGVESLFIEGAGGLMVPLNENETWIDFLKHTGIPVILVVGLKLGCINHALLTEAALKANKIKCVGWIANCHDPDMLALSDNISTLKRILKFRLLGTVSYSSGLSNVQKQLF